MSKVLEFIFPKPFLIRLADFITDPRDASAFSRTSRHTLLFCYAYLCRILSSRYCMFGEIGYSPEIFPSDFYLYYQCLKLEQLICYHKHLVVFNKETFCFDFNFCFELDFFLVNSTVQVDAADMCHCAICMDNVKLFTYHWNRTPNISTWRIFKEAINRAKEPNLSILRFLIDVPKFATFYKEQLNTIFDLIVSNWRVFNLFKEVGWISSALILDATLMDYANYLVLHKCLTEVDIIKSIQDDPEYNIFINGNYDPDEVSEHLLQIEMLCYTKCVIPYLKSTVDSLLEYFKRKNVQDDYEFMLVIKEKYF